MPQFSNVTVADVAPKPKSPNLGVRKAAFRLILDQVTPLATTSEDDPNRASLVITLDATDKALTIRQQIDRAAAQLGITMYVRRKGNVITAYKTGTVAPAA